MATPDLINYIKNQLKLGRSEEVIRAMLKNAGWQDADIEEGLKEVSSNISDAPLPKSAPKNFQGFQPTFYPLTGQEQALPGAGVLLKNAWQIYKSRFWTLLGIALFPFLALIGAGLMLLLIVGAQKLNFSGWLTLVLLILGIIFSFLSLFLFVWSRVALLFAIKDNLELIGVKESFKRAKGKILSFIWIGLLNGIVIFGGFVLGIVPGIIFGIWFIIAQFVFVAEGHKGFNALLRSKEYVSGRWWSVAWRMLAVGFISILIYLIGVVTGFIPSELFVNIVSVILGIVNFLFYIFLSVYLFSLYNSLKETRPQLVGQPVSAKRGFFIFCAILGVLTPFIIALALIFIMQILIK